MDVPITFRPGHELVVTTQFSTWTVREDKYLRSPLGGERPALDSIDGAGKDDVWEEHQGAWVVEYLGTFRLRVLPSTRPPEFYGLRSSPIINVEEREFDDSDKS